MGVGAPEYEGGRRVWLGPIVDGMLAIKGVANNSNKKAGVIRDEGRIA